MTENPQQTDPDVPSDDELDVEGPNESGPGHNPPDEGAEDAQDQS